MTGVRLGTDTGSSVNYLMQDGNKDREFEIGEGATILAWTDRRPATVVAVRGDKRKVITIQEDHATRTDSNGMSESQTYTFAPDPDGMDHEVTWQKGAWRIKGGGEAIRFGVRKAYRDFTF